MGILVLPSRTKEGMLLDGNEKRYGCSRYSNINAVENLIRYVTRTRNNEKRAKDLIVYGGAGVGYYLSPEEMIRQFLYVQKANKIDLRNGRRAYHEIFCISDDEARSLHMSREELWNFGMECCQVFYMMGFQVVFAVHWEKEKRLHIHFVVNSINYRDGHKFHTNFAEKEQREEIFNQILQNHQLQI